METEATAPVAWSWVIIAKRFAIKIIFIIIIEIYN
jgi:hypothetical protein